MRLMTWRALSIRPYPMTNPLAAASNPRDVGMANGFSSSPPPPPPPPPGLAAPTRVKGLMDSARHVINQIVNPRF
jgi:hypothetical protein